MNSIKINENAFNENNFVEFSETNVNKEVWKGSLNKEV